MFKKVIVMSYNKKFIAFLVIAFFAGFGCAELFPLRKHTIDRKTKVKEYVFLGNKEETYKCEEFDKSIYEESVDPNGVYNRPNGVIPNDSLAVEMAKIVLFPIYGKKNIEHQRPYQVTLVNNEFWCIEGSLSENADGGTFSITINKSDGKVRGIFHGK